MKKRVLTGVVAGGVAVAATLLLDSRWLLFLVSALMAVAAFEIARMGRFPPERIARNGSGVIRSLRARAGELLYVRTVAVSFAEYTS